MVCSQCDELRTQVKELERALDRAVWIEDSEAKAVAREWKLAPGPAHVVVALWKAKRNFLTRMEIDAMVPKLTTTGKPRIDPDYRQPASIGTWVGRVRKKCGQDFVESQLGAGVGGHRLSPGAHKRVSAILACA